MVTIGVGEEAARAIRALSFAYAEAMDRRAPALLLDAFADDAVVEVFRGGDSDTPTGRYQGRDELASIPPALERWPSTLHDVMSVALTSQGDGRARGSVECLAHHFSYGPGGTEDRVMRITYEDEYRRVEGRWVIAGRQVRIREDRVTTISGEQLAGG